MGPGAGQISFADAMMESKGIIDDATPESGWRRILHQRLCAAGHFVCCTTMVRRVGGFASGVADDLIDAARLNSDALHLKVAK